MSDTQQFVRRFRLVVGSASIGVLAWTSPAEIFYWQFPAIVAAIAFASVVVNRIRRRRQPPGLSVWAVIAIVWVRDWTYGSQYSWHRAANEVAWMAVSILIGQWIGEQIPLTRKRDIIDSP